jgi:hypothetical protein
LPKDTLLELTVKPAVPAGGCDTPVPLIWTVAEGLISELLVMTSCPVAEPAVAGPKWTLSVVVLFAASVSGNVPSPSNENDVLLTVSLEITTGLELEFTSETLLVAGLPTVTEPNATVVGDAVKLPALALDAPFATTPPQPASEMQPPRTTNARSRYESRFSWIRWNELDWLFSCLWDGFCSFRVLFELG